VSSRFVAFGAENNRRNSIETTKQENDMADVAPTGTTTGSDANQANLTARAEALYVKLMEKQMSFKEAVEPFKTDNQNAGKA
jgi:hypothetical protein